MDPRKEIIPPHPPADDRLRFSLLCALVKILADPLPLFSGNRPKAVQRNSNRVHCHQDGYLDNTFEGKLADLLRSGERPDHVFPSVVSCEPIMPAVRSTAALTVRVHTHARWTSTQTSRCFGQCDRAIALVCRHLVYCVRPLVSLAWGSDHGPRARCPDHLGGRAPSLSEDWIDHNDDSISRRGAFSGQSEQNDSSRRWPCTAGVRPRRVVERAVLLTPFRRETAGACRRTCERSATATR